MTAATLSYTIDAVIARLRELAQRGAISDYNITIAVADIAEVRTVLQSLQDELTTFRG